jgi:hypothetical protein
MNLDAMTWRDAVARCLDVNGLADARQDPDRRAWDAARSGNAGYVIADLDYKVGRLTRIVDLPVERRRLAACGVEGCTGSYLYTDGASIATCTMCRATMDIHTYRAWQLNQATGTPLPLARIPQIKSSTLRVQHDDTPRRILARAHLCHIFCSQNGSRVPRGLTAFCASGRVERAGGWFLRVALPGHTHTRRAT